MRDDKHFPILLMKPIYLLAFKDCICLLEMLLTTKILRSMVSIFVILEI